jgi:hypothetical protein
MQPNRSNTAVTQLKLILKLQLCGSEPVKFAITINDDEFPSATETKHGELG